MTTTTRAHVDVAVVGAGVIGTMTAREILTRHPDTELLVLDRDTVASGATHRSAGLHFPRGATERVRRMSAYSQDFYRRLRRERPDAPIRPVAMTVVAAETSEHELREAYLDRAELRRVPRPPRDWLRVPPGCAVWQGDGCQYADVPRLTQDLVRTLRERATWHEGVGVVEVRPHRDAVTLRLTNGLAVTAGCVVLAPGPWLAAPAWQHLVAPLGLRVKKVVALHLDIAPGEDDHALVFHDEDAFLLPLHHRGHWLFSYTCQEWDVDPDTVASGICGQDLHQAQAVLARYAPRLVERCTSGRVFCDAYSPTREPVVAALDEHRRTVFVGAANGSGYRLAPAMAAEAVGLLPPLHHRTGTHT